MSEQMLETITLFAPKGGAGRTTSVASLALGLINLGKRVLILDASIPARVRGLDDVGNIESNLSSPLLKWAKSVMEHRNLGGQITFKAVVQYSDISDDLLEYDDTRAWDYALIDTSPVVDREALFSIISSDLVLLPVRNIFDVQILPSLLTEIPQCQSKLCRGLSIGYEVMDPQWHDAADIPFLNYGVPALGTAAVIGACSVAPKEVGNLARHVFAATKVAEEIINLLDNQNQRRWEV